MILCHSLRDAKRASYFRNSQAPVVLKQQFQESDGVWMQLTLWGHAGKLLPKVCYLLFKVRILRFQRRNLLRKQRDLLLKQIDYVFAKSSCGRDPGDFLRRIDRAHINCESKPNQHEISNGVLQKPAQT